MRAVTPEELRRRAAALDKEGEALLRKGQSAEAAKRFVEAEVYEAAAAEMARLGVVQGRIPNQRGNVDRMVSTAASLRMSKGRAGDKPEPFQKAVNDAGYTVRSLVEKLRAEGYRVSHPFLNQARKGVGKRGVIRIRKPLAERIEALTGFRATKANWPGGWAREPSE